MREPRKMHPAVTETHTVDAAVNHQQLERSPKPMSNAKIEQAVALMKGFGQRTGLTSQQDPRRYLWTDAFAVCNFLGLARTTGNQRYTELALRLVDQVHHSLGKHRTDSPARGWISGLSEPEGEAHPTRGGLRIGKALPERRADESYDQQLEWERDGQYFHYLTKWMHALDQVTRSTGEPRYRRWASELAVAAHDAFSYLPPAHHRPRMYWKMSVDLSRPLVSSMGQHDPLDGYVTFMQLSATLSEQVESLDKKGLARVRTQFSTMLQSSELATADPLGIGGMLADAYRVEQLIRLDATTDDALIKRLLDAALSGIRTYANSGELQAQAHYRLAFRELGLSIGLEAVKRMHEDVLQKRSSLGPQERVRLEALLQYVPIGDEIESFWRQPGHQGTDTWLEHRDINEVMLATRLAADGFLDLVTRD
ncbi:MAG: hypothetical protein WBM81_03435 [Sedimenticolaceae bacterium]